MVHADSLSLVLDAAFPTAHHASVATGGSEVWQARITHDEAERLRCDAETLGLATRTAVVRAALAMLRRSVAEERMVRSIDAFYGGELPPTPVGVRRRRPGGER